MTRDQQLVYLDHLEGLVAANLDYARHRFMQAGQNIWATPHEEEPPNEWGRVAMGCAGMAAVIVLMSAAHAIFPGVR